MQVISPCLFMTFQLIVECWLEQIILSRKQKWKFKKFNIEVIKANYALTCLYRVLRTNSYLGVCYLILGDCTFLIHKCDNEKCLLRMFVKSINMQPNQDVALYDYNNAKHNFKLSSWEGVTTISRLFNNIAQ